MVGKKWLKLFNFSCTSFVLHSVYVIFIRRKVAFGLVVWLFVLLLFRIPELNGGFRLGKSLINSPLSSKPCLVIPEGHEWKNNNLKGIELYLANISVKSLKSNQL